MSESLDTWATANVDPREPPSVFVQWKGTDACIDFYCPCGYHGHFDGPFAYGLRCRNCGRAWTLPHTLGLIPDPDEATGSIQDTEHRHEPRPTAGYELTEYAIRMSGGGMHVRNPAPEIVRVYPLAEWIEGETRLGGHVYRRRVIVVSDWEEVTEP